MPASCVPHPGPATGSALFAGSFDPFTAGHLHVVAQGLRAFNSVTVAVAANAGKSALFSARRRVELARCSLREAAQRENRPEFTERVTVVAVEGLVAAYAQRVGASALIRGVRGGSDLDSEAAMAHLNDDLGALPTLLVVASRLTGHVSSSAVKDIARHGGPVGSYVSECVASALGEVFQGKELGI